MRHTFCLLDLLDSSAGPGILAREARRSRREGVTASTAIGGRQRRDWWRTLHPTARTLMATRFLRSIGQGALVVDFVLYLEALHWNAVTIGALLTGAGLGGTALMLGSGTLSDRFGRRPFLLGYQLATAVGALALVLDPRSWILVLSTVLLGCGRGANGAAGPFGPVEHAWLAQSVPPADRGQVFSLNGALGFWGMGLGAWLGAAVPLLGHLLPGPSAYRPLFALSLVIAVVNLLQVASIRGADLVRRPAPAGEAAAARNAATAGPADAPVRRRENVAMALLTAVNSVNALGIGLFSPLLVYWLSVRYGVGSAAIGSTYAVALILTGVSSVMVGEMTTRIGIVRSVVWVRVVGVGLLAAMPLMPTYRWAAAIYVVRSIFNRGSAGARQAFGVSLVRDERKGLASSLNGLSMRLPSALGPALAGWLMEGGSLDLPFYCAAALQLAYVVLFGTVLGRYDRPPARGVQAASG